MKLHSEKLREIFKSIFGEVHGGVYPLNDTAG